MKTSDHPIDSQDVTAAVQAARKRFAKAESIMEAAAQRASIAKRKRKEAKEAARSAKKELKSAKKELAAAKRELADTEKSFTKAASKIVKNVEPPEPAKAAKPAPMKNPKPKAVRTRIRRKPVRAVAPPAPVETPPAATSAPTDAEPHTSTASEGSAMPAGELGGSGGADQTQG